MAWPFPSNPATGASTSSIQPMFFKGDPWELSVFGKPAPQGSKRLLGKQMVESSPNVAPWRSDVKYTAQQSMPKGWDPTGYFHLEVTFRFKRPASHFNKAGVKDSAPKAPISRQVGDLDKLQRSLLDALTSVAWDDDSQVISIKARKDYCQHEQLQGAFISIYRLE